jgi:hypothetical protein
MNQNIDLSNTLGKFAANVPVGLRLNNISIDNSVPAQPSFRATGPASTNTEVNYFVSLLRKEPTFTDIALTSLGVDQNRITFSLVGNLKPTN